ncbi:hypothetical protein F4818DRAFT_45498 [Hypoxylon cercidicola]|nr:hypothetical protein F4818DRAFT_45498 [Hypoxylon cercidicola]
MVSNETSQPMTEIRDEISPVGTPTPTNREDVPTATTRPSESRVPVTESAPPLPKGKPTTQPPSPARQQPLPQPYPHYQLPYAPYPYQGQPYPYGTPMQAPPPYSRAWTISKLVLTILSTVWAIIIIALACVFIGEQGDGEFTSYYALPIAIAAVLWNGAELITYAVRSRKDVKRGIHPGAHVGLHLCFWIACVFAILLTVWITLALESTIRDCADEEDSRYSYDSYCDDYHYKSNSYMNNMYLPTLRAMTAIFCLATINHFVLFVLACIDTNRRNCMKPAGFVMPPAPAGGMYYPLATPPGAAPYYPYPYPMPMPPQQARVAPQPSMSGAAGPRVSPTDATAQNYQNLAGFYAPAPGMAPPRAAPSPARATPSPVSEKAVVTTSAPAGTAL